MVHGSAYAAIAEGLASLGANHGVADQGNVALVLSNAPSCVPISSGTIHATALARHRRITM